MSQEGKEGLLLSLEYNIAIFTIISGLSTHDRILRLNRKKSNVTLKITATEMQSTGLAFESVWTSYVSWLVFSACYFHYGWKVKPCHLYLRRHICSRVKSSQSRLNYYFKMLKATWKALWQEISPAGDQK